MKLKRRYFTAFLSTILVVSNIAVASEIYNKDGNKIDLFGTVKSSYYFSKDNNKNGDHSSINYGLRGETRINDQLIGFGLWQYERGLHHDEDSSNTKDDHTCLGYVGIKFGNLGIFDYGRNHGILYTVGSWTDIQTEFSGDTSIIDNFLSNRASNVATYRNNNFFGLVDGLNFALQYQIKNDQGMHHSLKTSNGDGYGISVSYTINNDISAAVAYSNSSLSMGQKELEPVYESEEENQNNNHRRHVEACSFGLKYDSNNIYLAGLYNEASNMFPFGNFAAESIENENSNNLYGFAKKVKNIELVAQYLFDFGLRSSVGYLQSKGFNIGDEYNKCYLKKYIEIGNSYNLNSNMLTFVDYRINLLKKNNFTSSTNISTDNILALGMIYTF